MSAVLLILKIDSSIKTTRTKKMKELIKNEKMEMHNLQIHTRRR